MRLIRTLVAVVLVAGCSPALALGGPAAVAKAVEEDYDAHLGALFEHFHRHPELSFREADTAAHMADELRQAGAEVTSGVGGHGVVGLIRNGAGPLVMIRADMDGLPIREQSGLAYASTRTQSDADGVDWPVMHACGHDAHITSLVGTARQLVAMRGQWSGTVMLVVQPAEERSAGAKAMLADRLFERFGKPDFALAFHVSADHPTGTVSAAEGLMYSSADSVDILVHGVGGHGAAPHQTRDPVYIGAQIVTALQSIISRERHPLRPGVITVGAFHAGNKHNIIPDRAELQLTIRANDEDTRAMLQESVRRVATNIARAHGVPEDRLPEVRITPGTPVNANDPALARRLNAVMTQALDAEAVVPFSQILMAGEDFAYFAVGQTGIPSYYFVVGGTPPEVLAAARNGGPPVPSHHSAQFRIAPRESVTLGTRAMVAAVLELAPR